MLLLRLRLSLLLQSLLRLERCHRSSRRVAKHLLKQLLHLLRLLLCRSGSRRRWSCCSNWG